MHKNTVVRIIMAQLHQRYTELYLNKLEKSLDARLRTT